MSVASVGDLTPSVQNYLKAIWSLQEWTTEPVTASRIAERVELRTSTVSGALAKLTEQGLIEHDRYGAVDLTPAGRAMALAMVRRHRLIETFLVQVLDYSWDQVDDEAENLEHAVSDFMVDRIDQVLGRPTRDPHGDPIPDADGVITLPDAVRLTEVAAGSSVLVERISDRDPGLLQHLESTGVLPGARLTVGEGEPYSGAIEVRVGDGDGVNLGTAATDAVFVTVLD
ncbi:MAG: metal-dependent transcriptional regulator [Aeromicrobium sp.]|uniref:metal-dependent transcriptional regulator n=1 Tax=Aeromicrobium sp. TaxID=1871063 RepID=UPI002625AD4A|nr:metal-dependent transcriptional regulator [Aeromicrobium sp.]MDF1706279.1 metal-dependent transcriptional regulator [Aeromicrobium sp.]